MAGAERFDIVIKGKGGHAAMPHTCVDPIVVGSQIVSAMQTLVSRTSNPVDPVVISITNFNAGTGAFNVIPDDAVLSGTMRSFDPTTRDLMIRRIKEITVDTAKTLGAAAECVFMKGGYDPTVNTLEETQECIKIAQEIVGADNVDTEIDPSMGAEDFGAMLQAVPGCYIWMGQGEDDANSMHNQGLHTPQYDFNDDIIPAGIEYWVRLVESALKRS